MSVSRVLVIGLSNVGDAVLSGDAITALRRRYPEAHLTLVAGERACALYRDDPRITTLVNMDQFSSPAGYVRLAWALWRFKPQVVVDFRKTVYPVLLKPATAWRYFRRPPASITHMRQRHLWTLRMQAGVAAEPDGEAVWLSPNDCAHAEALKRKWQLDPARPLVVICPGSRNHTKRWLAEGYARVADRLQEEGAQVVFSGEPAEEEVIGQIQQLMRAPARSLVGSTTVRQAAAIIAGAALVITTDSAALHLASALKVP
ncbi:MAG: glycosyltransferase family 9 protein, partial [Dehalococcoidia bacterium]|nr:glycosyltransferase family 9 protein [Dehalococcoidia bacterium]